MNSLSGSLRRFLPMSIVQHGLNARFLYNSASTGIDDYIASRKRYEQRAGVDENKFRKKMWEICSDPSGNNLVFTEDLKQMLHWTRDTEEDLNLIEKMMLKFHSQTSHLRFGSYVFGPVVMRMYHYLNKPEEALKAYKDEKLDGFFDQLSSHIVLMDLLFKNKMYEEVIEIYKIMREKQLQFGRHPKSLMVLVFGAYYKLNTLKHYEEALNLFKEMNESGHIPLRRAVCFMAALALKENQPDICVEILSSLQNQKYVLVRCIKALALSEIGRVEDAVSVLRSVLEYDRPETEATKHTFPKDVVKQIETAVEKLNNKQLNYDFNRIYNQLKEQGHLKDTTLDEILCSEVVVMQPMNQTQSVLNAAMNSSRNNQKKTLRYQRLGLEEII